MNQEIWYSKIRKVILVALAHRTSQRHGGGRIWTTAIRAIGTEGKRGSDTYCRKIIGGAY